MSGVNKVIVVGNVGADPVLNSTQSGDPVANLSVATSESWKDKEGNKQENTEWHKIVLWRKLADLVKEYVSKGDQIGVEGKLQTRSWEQDGKTRYTTEIVASNIYFLGGKNGSPKGGKQEALDIPDESEDVPF